MLVQYLSICVSMFIGLEGKTRFSFTKNMCGVGDNPVQWCFGLLLLPGNQIKHECWVYNNLISVSFNNVLFYSACSSFYVFNELGCKYINRIYCVRKSVVVKRSKFGSDRLKKKTLKTDHMALHIYIYCTCLSILPASLKQGSHTSHLDYSIKQAILCRERSRSRKVAV